MSEVQNISFYCQNGTSQLCCYQLAHRVSSDNHSRCASIVLKNNSGYRMNLEAQNLEDGRWITSEDYKGGNNISINCQPRSLLNNESETISSVTGRFIGGLTGYVSFNILDNMTSNFTISWKVPLFGSPQYDLNGLSEHDYEVIKNSTFEDTVYIVTINAINKNKKPFILIIIFSVIAIVIAIVLVLVIISCYIRRIRRPNVPPNPGTRR
ncbi:hypothetical protein C1645_816560 [Glomus cerebriforme]|uniref:Uncharacterized protein n=1 Tax=Glomus cerebriforme TaxID=658196 RepID=A0A397TKV8_9GLOM|nr:hypothetical protein C1645_816560 [Glomus cerebriforme]